MQKIMIAWIGRTDLLASEGVADVGLGPIAQAVEALPFDHLYLITNFEADKSQAFGKWLLGRGAPELEVSQVEISNPMDFGRIYEITSLLCQSIVEQHNKTSLYFHLSPGTPAMAAVWILLSKTRFPAKLVESSREHGAHLIDVPFDLSMEFVPDLLKIHDVELSEKSAAHAPDTAAFEDIIFKSRTMQRLVDKAAKVSKRNIPVLIEGETGTGKELLAKAIHRSSLRVEHPFVAVNCGAIPSELVESELFGHEKGSFTGANTQRKGFFETANGGTLFLDEVGELPQPVQVKLLRVLQEGEIVRIGSSSPIHVDVRIIAATNRNLIHEVSAGNFREDLFYRVAVALLRIPPLRERHGDVGLLIDYFFEKLDAELASDPGYNHKNLSVRAKNLLLRHQWPGNVRELINTIYRVLIWSDSDRITTEDVEESIIETGQQKADSVLSYKFDSDFNINNIIDIVTEYYLVKAMDEAHGNKTQAAKLLGLSSYQTLSNWLRKFGVE